MYKGVSPYLHVLDGRIRVRVPRLKGSPAQAARLEAQLRHLEGVTSARANPLTGNVLVHFDRHQTCADVVLDWIMQGDWLPTVDWPACTLSPTSERERSAMIQPDHLARIVVNTVIETALRRLVTRLIV